MSNSQITPSSTYQWILDQTANGDTVNYFDGNVAGRMCRVLITGGMLEDPTTSMYFDECVDNAGEIKATVAGRFYYLGNGVDGPTTLSETAEGCAEMIINQMIKSQRERRAHVRRGARHV